MWLALATQALVRLALVGAHAGPAKSALGATPSFTIAHDAFLKDGEPFNLRSGSIHYSRVPAAYWTDRLKRMKALGLNTVTTYVPWNWHAPSLGVPSDWSGDRDLAAFLSACHGEGLLVLLRPGPYICGEWEFGGFPAWLLNASNVALRTADTRYLAAVDAWWGELLPVVKPHLYSVGGPIVIVQLENEFHGSCDSDPKAKQYMEHLYSLATTHLGTDVIYSIISQQQGCFRGDRRVFTTVDGGLSQDPAGYLAAFAGQKAANAPGNSPPMWTELWEGWFTEWWEDTAQQNKSSVDVGAGVAAMLAANGSFSLYMAHGGTNFGFWSGAEGGGAGYQPILTSYDYNAPIGEAGQHTIGSDGGDVYVAVRDAIAKKYGAPSAIEPPAIAKAEYGAISLTEEAPLLASSATLSSCGTTQVILDERGHMPTMERLGQSYGLILYSRARAPWPVQIEGGMPVAGAGGQLAFSGRTMHDRVQIFVDGASVATVYRPECGCAVNGPGSYCHVTVPATGGELQLLVENMGRVNFGQISAETKGIDDGPPMSGNWSAQCISLEPAAVRRLPFKRWRRPVTTPLGKAGVEHASQTASTDRQQQPVFRRGVLLIDGTPKDTYLDSRGLTKGYIWVNGHNLGRYWETAGPQHALYCPAPFLRTGKNEVIVLDLHGAGGGGSVHSVASQRWEAPATLPPPLPTPPAQDSCERWCGKQKIPGVQARETMQCCQCNASAGIDGCQSSSQVPSCAMGCAAAKLTPTLLACEQACNSSWHSCDFKVAGRLIGTTCAMCPCGCGPGNDASGCIAGCRREFLQAAA
jgi:hypothetical protein